MTMLATRGARATLAALLGVLAACQAAERSPQTAPAGLPALRALDEAHAAEFRGAFDEDKTRPRYMVALSPT